jgi:hypothetical protein
MEISIYSWILILLILGLFLVLFVPFNSMSLLHVGFGVGITPGIIIGILWSLCKVVFIMRVSFACFKYVFLKFLKLTFPIRYSRVL